MWIPLITLCLYACFRSKLRDLCFFFYVPLLLILQRGRRGTNSGGEDEAEDEPHTPLPPPMEIIKDPSAQEEKVQKLL